MVTLVAAMGRNREIGIDNQLPWHLPNDLKHFKTITSGHPVIMGRKTFESLGKPLPNRTNIVISRRTDWFQEGILIVGSIKEALKFAKKIDEEVFVIGGGNVYEQTILLADRLELTQVQASIEADTFFPEIDTDVWIKTDVICHDQDEKHNYAYCFQTYERKAD